MTYFQNRQGGPMGRGGGRGGMGRGRGDEPGRFGDRGPGGPMGRGRGGFGDNFGGGDETQFPVPAEKCGLVIGKGKFSF